MALSKNAFYLVGGLILLVIGYLWMRGIKGTVSDLVKGTGDAAAGVVTGTGRVLGVPETNKTQCQIDLANGEYWKASFSCPASDFFKGLFGANEGATTNNPNPTQDAQSTPAGSTYNFFTGGA